jgi:hypothetical protein
MRPHLMEPQGELTAELLSDVLTLVSVTIPPERITRWTHLERVLAYDWAWRLHLRASDNLNHARQKPWFVTRTETEAAHG